MTDSPSHFIRENSGITELRERAGTAYLGVKEGLTYIAPFVEDQFLVRQSGERTEPIGEFPDLADRWSSIDADVAVLVAPTDVVNKLAEPGDIRAVSRIHQVVDTSRGAQDVLSRLSRREVRRRRQAEKDGFGYDVSHQDEHFFEFYRNMHVPTMHNRYGGNARSVAEEKAFRTLFREGVLFRVHKSGEWVSGSVSQIDRRSRTLNARLIGVKAGDDRYRSAGAQNYVYHAILDWAAEADDIDIVDFQGCEPFLTKGTLQYKKRFGTTAIIPANIFGDLRMLIRLKSLTPSVRRFLVNNPVLAEGPDGSLVAKYFHDKANDLRSDIPHSSPGITGTSITDLDEL
ncbi:hypothetical protein FHR81_002059 [Actinoalloteichus hoggarensis]|uniref:Uncharacterized protein n=1 Tax=Actinoalloteichus hoggarensis TaxID=1470176 RepID=A0A221W5V7_9PSEU|nr:hypothetical protein [Actinoalloteichus hoggarensis]ASO21091.1 hypothetical protein AHOG_17330 [Actinoalloteichus hoggarensis]MBB5921021.1 hypothetical protein [Actinoalloteichus hoggarensis]